MQTSLQSCYVQHQYKLHFLHFFPHTIPAGFWAIKLRLFCPYHTHPKILWSLTPHLKENPRCFLTSLRHLLSSTDLSIQLIFFCLLLLRCFYGNVDYNCMTSFLRGNSQLRTPLFPTADGRCHYHSQTDLSGLQTIQNFPELFSALQ